MARYFTETETGRREGVNLTQCPYDGAEIEADIASGGSLVVVCPSCDAAWESHGAWIRRVREPDRERLLAARRNGASSRVE